MKEDSLRKRYGYKILSKIIIAPIMMAMQAIIPRGLGPAAYGEFTFLTNLFQQVIGFFDSGTSLAFYTKLSQDLKDRSIIRFYFGFICVASLVIVLGTSGTLVLKLDDWAFPGQKTLFVWLAILYTVLIWFSESVYKIVDAYGLTVKGELIQMAQKGVALLILAILFGLGYISLVSFFIYNYVVTLILIFLWIYCLHKNGIAIFNIPSLSLQAIKEKIGFFWNYSSPLMMYCFLGMIVGIFDNWLLIKMSGSVQQGYFGLAFKLSSISFLFTGAMTQLITREFSIAHGLGDKQKIARLYNRFVPILYVIVAFLSIFFAVHAKTITYLFGGAGFKGAVLPIALMSLYPIHQTYGQLSGSLFYATRQTRLYRNIGISMMPVSLLFTWLMIGPNIYWGLGLGALGLAIKTVATQFITVNIQIGYNLKYLSLSFWKYFLNQILIVIVLLTLAFAGKIFCTLFIDQPIILFSVSGIIYFLLSVAFFYMFPQVISMTKPEINRSLIQARNIIQKQFNFIKPRH